MNAEDWGKSKRELQEPCEICTDGQTGEALIAEIDTNVYLEKGWLEVETLDEDTDRVQFSAKINYCPMCGRKLSDK